MGGARRTEDWLRLDARRILEAALEAVSPGPLVRSALERPANGIEGAGPVVVLAYGKAAAGMATAAAECLGERVREGVIVVPHGTRCVAPPRHRVFEAGHPEPDADSVDAARAVEELARGAGEGTLVLVLLSGGGSALVALPPHGISPSQIGSAVRRLSDGGADIETLNRVRRHLDLLKGGRLAAAAHPARVVGLVLSDVPGDDPAVVASGPLVPDGSDYADALAAVGPFGGGLPRSVIGHLEAGARGRLPPAPRPGDPAFRDVRVDVIGSGTTAAVAAEAAARALGYDVERPPAPTVGDAAEAGGRLADWARSRAGKGPACRIAIGETTVRVVGSGRGGRNQHLALAAAVGLDGVASVVVGSLATDGVDGPTDAAGAVISGTTVRRAREAGLDVDVALRDNDAYTVLDATGDLLKIGPTGTNVADIHLALVE